MAALSSLASYGDSDSSDGDEDVRKEPVVSKVTSQSKNKSLLLHDKDKAGKVKVYLPQISSPKKIDTKEYSVSSSDNMTKGLKGLMSVLPQPKNRHKINQPSSASPSSSSSSSSSFLHQVTKGDDVASRKRPGGSSLFIPYTLTSKTPKTTPTTTTTTGTSTETSSTKRKTNSDSDDDDDDEEEEKERGSFLFLKESEDTSAVEPIKEPPLQGPYLEESSVQPYSTAAHSYTQPYSTMGPYSEPYSTVGPYSEPYSTVGPSSESYSTVGPYSEPYSTVEPYSEASTVQPSQSEDGDLELNEDIVRRLAGKRRGQKMNEETASLQQVKNVTETEIKDGVKVFQKYSTEQSATSGMVPEHLAFTSDHKRKHHITWLAHQAKSREVELKNFWAESAAQRRQTKMKYGF